MSMTKAELEDRVTELEQENERLRGELEQVQADGGTDALSSGTKRPEPQEPSFGLSEGERSDLEVTGRAVSPFTGDIREGTPDDYTTTPPAGRKERSEDYPAATPEKLPDDPPATAERNE